jgi:hypothetical protein
MRRVIVRYKVKPELVGENEQLIRTVFEELARVQPAGLRYASFKLADGVSFVHVASIETPEGNPLTALASFKAFSRDIAARCDEAPVALDAEPIGNYRVFG